MRQYSVIMQAEREVDVSFEIAKQWFLQLKDHPEKYTFASHQGFTFINGDFGEVGSLFYTKERFLGVVAKLTFRLTEVTTDSFSFEMLKPLRNVKGIYAITKKDEATTVISLAVLGSTNFTHWLLKFYPLQQAVRHQINSEVAHIKASLESA